MESRIAYGLLDGNGQWRDAYGNILAASVTDALVINAGLVTDYKDQADRGQTGNPTAPGEAPSDDRPRLCPTPNKENFNGRSLLTIMYQHYVTGLDPGLEVTYNAVRYDGCDEHRRGVLLEAKANYLMALDSNGNWQPWFDWKTQFRDKLKNQSKAAALGGRMVEWHVLQKEIADAIRPLAAPYTNVHVIYDPMPPEWWSGIK